MEDIARDGFAVQHDFGLLKNIQSAWAQRV
jgi:hypothetical protein